MIIFFKGDQLALVIEALGAPPVSQVARFKIHFFDVSDNLYHLVLIKFVKNEDGEIRGRQSLRFLTRSGHPRYCTVTLTGDGEEMVS